MQERGRFLRDQPLFLCAFGATVVKSRYPSIDLGQGCSAVGAIYKTEIFKASEISANAGFACKKPLTKCAHGCKSPFVFNDGASLCQGFGGSRAVYVNSRKREGLPSPLSHTHQSGGAQEVLVCLLICFVQLPYTINQVLGHTTPRCPMSEPFF